MNKEFQKILYFGLLGSVAACAPKEPEQPNIIFIMSDDHAEKAISCYGHGLNHTPNIDRIASDGVRFTNATVTNSISAPSRAVLLTGKHSHMNGHPDNQATFDSSQQTFPKLLRVAGYQTALIGKWHLKSQPSGFDHWMVLPGQGQYYNPDFITPSGKKRIEGYVTDIITNESLNWLESRTDKTKPFCLMIHHKAPHRNWQPAPNYLNHFDSANIPVPENFFDDYASRGSAARLQEMEIARHMYPAYDLKLTDKDSDNLIDDGQGNWMQRFNQEQKTLWQQAYRKKNKEFYLQNLQGRELARWKYRRYMQDYLATVQSIDDSVGEILAYLDKNGLDENTIVVYTSDQGFYLGEHGWYDKRFMYEESLSTPLLIRFPKGIKRGWVSDKLVQNLDLAQTFLDYAGVPIPEDMQGLSMKPLLGQRKTNWRDAVYYHYYEYPGTHAVKRHYGVKNNRYKLIHFYYDCDEWELYDLQTDPYENKNLYNQPGYEKTTQSLKAELERLKVFYQVPSVQEELEQRLRQIEHSGIGKKIELKYLADEPFKKDASVLLDGKSKNQSIFWLSDFSSYLGFKGNNLEATIDLGQVQNIREISLTFLQKQESWIYAPKSIELKLSADGKTYFSCNWSETGNWGHPEHVGPIESTSTEINKKARFIRLKALNTTKIPDGMHGAGNPAWLFCDEIVVR
jgi:arylsulfatase A-like enzyme